MAGRLTDLSPAEVECLRLVAAGVTTSKAIAERTRLSPGTIDTYLSRAARTLGAGSRREAASRYVELVEQAAQRGSTPAGVHEASQLRSQSRSGRLAASADGRLSGVTTGVRWLFSVPPVGGPEHSLTWIEKTFAILRIAAVSLSTVLVLVMACAGLLWVFE